MGSCTASSVHSAQNQSNMVIGMVLDATPISLLRLCVRMEVIVILSMCARLSDTLRLIIFGSTVKAMRNVSQANMKLQISTLIAMELRTVELLFVSHARPRPMGKVTWRTGVQ